MAINDIPNLQFNNQSNSTVQSQNQYSQYGQNPRPINSNLFQPQAIFMQPIGNIYGLGNSAEIGSIPIGSGVSAGLCLSEGTLYLKSMQANGPAILGYKLTPLELVNQQNPVPSQPVNKQEDLAVTIGQIEKLLQKYDTKINELSDEISNLQSQLQNSNKGGSKKWEV